MKPIDYTKTTWQERKQIREQYIDSQDNLCWFCKCSLSGPPAQFVEDASLNMSLFPRGFLDHHDHKTHMTIGAVHSKCNGYLWQYLGE